MRKLSFKTGKKERDEPTLSVAVNSDDGLLNVGREATNIQVGSVGGGAGGGEFLK